MALAQNLQRERDAKMRSELMSGAALLAANSHAQVLLEERSEWEHHAEDAWNQSEEAVRLAHYYADPAGYSEWWEGEDWSQPAAEWTNVKSEPPEDQRYTAYKKIEVRG